MKSKKTLKRRRKSQRTSCQEGSLIKQRSRKQMKSSRSCKRRKRLCLTAMTMWSRLRGNLWIWMDSCRVKMTVWSPVKVLSCQVRSQLFNHQLRNLPKCKKSRSQRGLILLTQRSSTKKRRSGCWTKSTKKKGKNTRLMIQLIRTLCLTMRSQCRRRRNIPNEDLIAQLRTTSGWAAAIAPQ